MDKVAAGMGPIVEEAEEFGEDLLFHDDDHDHAASAESDQDDLDASPAAPIARDEDAAADTSAKSSLIHEGLAMAMAGADDDEQGDEEDQVPPLHHRQIAASMPTHSGHVRMGSSVPVSIPHMGRWKKADQTPDSPTGPAVQFAAATFVPPHQFSQVNDFTFSFTGDSPSVAIKRERLRARNAILKSTGFLEPGAAAAANLNARVAGGPMAAGGLRLALGGASRPDVAAAVQAVIESS
ncbi:hypothetical protein HYH03_016026 [Edaphochlamys debaryana]|uniref:Uncharacterized protein n=1 Tax=Edaphochlamys debaryana TaxID=47281 RepID=A0A835XQN8_9CHLO|nr:hypothetical protein HYH03_016026 [Edaphochlamys debaryana]|eukprot:KAG2485240.1 hypothetical protein HYH03_016026 [Edaphochlamys debaryana]